MLRIDLLSLLCYNKHIGGDDMKKFKVTSYHKSNALMPSNGGTLIITDTEYIIKYLFITVAKYKIDNTLASKISFASKGISLSREGASEHAPKARDFGAFWLFVQSRRQPCFLLSTKNHHKIPRLWGRRIFMQPIFSSARHKTQQILSDLRVF